MGIKVNLRDLPRELRKLNKRLKAATEAAIRKTARDAIPIITPRVPKAFGELVDSLEARNPNSESVVAQTVASAPHAAPVETGSRPHTPDFEALLSWVKLRGLQGLTRKGNIRTRFAKTEGPTTPGQAMGVALALRELEVRGNRRNGRHSPIDAPEQVARRISEAIQKGGTKPHWFVRDSLPEIEAKLGENIQSALSRV